jgi:hypothetical protein
MMLLGGLPAELLLAPLRPEGVIMAAFLRELIMAALNDGMCGITLSQSLPDMAGSGRRIELLTCIA